MNAKNYRAIYGLSRKRTIFSFLANCPAPFLVGVVLSLSWTAFASITERQLQKFNSDSYDSAGVATSPVSGTTYIPVLVGPRSGGCEQEACNIVSCNFHSDIDTVKKACSGGASGGCVRETCDRNGCSTQAELLQVIESCRKPADKASSSSTDSSSSHHGGGSGDCVSTICSHIGCNFATETESVARACKKASGSCVRSVCERAGCTFKSDALSAIKSCVSSSTVE